MGLGSKLGGGMRRRWDAMIGAVRGGGGGGGRGPEPFTFASLVVFLGTIK